MSSHEPRGKNSPQPPRLENAGQDGSALRLQGDWTAFTLASIQKSVEGQDGSDSVDATGINRLDTAGALAVQQLAPGKADSWRDRIHTENPDHDRLLDQVAPSAEKSWTPPASLGPGLRFLNDFGGTVVGEFQTAGALLTFLGKYLVTVGKAMLHPLSFRFTSLIYHMQQTGLAAVPIVALLSFLIGAVVAYMGAVQLQRFGAQVFVINLIEITVLRELGVLLTAILVAGRSGSSFTAQIGAMMANEEVAAMESMGLDPMNVLVIPRVMALTAMLPALVFLADVMGILGGGVALWSTMDMPLGSFLARMQSQVNLDNFWVGIIKAPFFAVTIGLVGCFQGFQVTGSAESVGRLTTHSVVQSIFLVIVIDAVFAIFFSKLGF